MSNSSPPEPPSSRKKILNRDEWIAIIVAFSTIPFIFFWVLGRRDGGFNLKESQFTLNLPKPASVTTDPGEQIASLPTIPGLDSDSEQSLSSSPATVSRDSDSEYSDSEKFPLSDTEQSLSAETTTSPDTDSEGLPFSETTASSALEESTPEDEEETASSESPIAIAPRISPTAIAPTTSSSASPTSPGEPIEFSDVPEDHWANHFIVVLSERRIMEGFPGNKFKPNQAVTRAELATVIQNVFDKTDTESAIDFEDIPEDHWANTAIDQAVKTGFMKGYPGEVFRPNQKVPRVQVLVALISGLDTTSPSSLDETLDIYQDKEQIPEWAIEKIATATGAGLVVNYPKLELINPNKPATRAEVAAMIYQALVILGQEEEFNSEYIVPSTSP